MRNLIQVEKHHTFTGHSDSVYNLVALTDDQFISASGDGNLICWDLKVFDKGKVIAKVPSSVYALAVDKERNQLIIGQNFEGIQIIDLEHKKVIGSLQFTDQAIFDLKVENEFIYAATAGGSFYKINSKQLKVEGKLVLSTQNLRSIEFWEQHIYVGTSEGKIKIIDKNTFNEKGEMLGHKQSVFALKTIENKPKMISGSRDANLSFWDLKNQKKLLNIPAHMYAVNDIAISPNDEFFATCSMDKSIKLWDLKSLDLLKVIDKSRYAGHGTSVNRLLWMKYENLLVSCSDDRSISVWNVKTSDNTL